MLATIIIPVSRQHRDTGIYREAEASAYGQSLPVVVKLFFDDDMRGAATARNAAMRGVTTPFVVFLDADDVLYLDFVRQTVRFYQPGHYVYTDYRLNGRVIEVPPVLHMLEVGQQHITAVLLPTAAWRAAGGFDETLDTLEDEDFFRRLHAYGWCGVKCPGALVDYRRAAGHSRVNQDSTDLDIIQQRVADKHALFHARYNRFMACGCKDNQPAARQAAANQPGANDILVKANYSPMNKIGPVTKRKYPRTGLGHPLWVDADDADARPDWWQKIAPNPVKVSPDVETVKKLAQQQAAPVAKKPRGRRKKNG